MERSLLANRYRVLQSLGQGGMGQVWLVEDTTDGRRMALKAVVPPPSTFEKSVLQFQQEFRLMTQLRHPNCCEVYDYGLLADGEPYFTMEVVPGRGLDELLPLDEETFRGVFSQLLHALGYVHQLGFVHRDLKSANVRVRPNGVVKLMDYGLMEHAGRCAGTIDGTLGYVAPEMIRRAPIDQRADLYSLGCLAYELLTGRLPFQGATPRDLLLAHLNEPPLAISRPVDGVSAELETLVLKLLAKEPTVRFQSAGEVLAALGEEASGGVGSALLSAPLLGRAQETAALAGHLDEVAQKRPVPPILVHGPAGMGKSRLVEELRFRAQLQNVPCGLGDMRERSAFPYAPFVGVLRSLLPAFRVHVPEELAREAPVLVKLLPELMVPQAPSLDSPSKEKMRLQASVTKLLAALARRQGLAIILENWHWADPSSLELLETVLRNASDAPFLVLLTSRQDHEAAAWSAHALRLPLAPLDREVLRSMVSTMLAGEDVGEDFLDQVAALSGGTPFYVERALEHLVRQGLLVRVQARWNARDALPITAMPQDADDLLTIKLAHLTPESAALARIAAVIGREFQLEWLQEVSDMVDATLFEAVEQLQAHAIFQSSGGGHAFVHDRLREVLYEAIPAEERAQLHGRTAAVLERGLLGQGLEASSLEHVVAVAEHYMAADVPEKTVLLALEAGKRNAELLAVSEAERFLKTGLAVIEVTGAEHWRPERLACLRHLADMQRIMGEREAADENYRVAIALAEELGETAHLGRMWTSRAKACQMFGRLDEAFDYCARSRDHCEATGDQLGLARSLMTSSRLHFFHRDRMEAGRQASRALAIAREALSLVHMSETLAFLGYMHIVSEPETIEAGILQLREAIDLAIEANDNIGLQEGLNLLGSAQNTMGDFAAALETYTWERQICLDSAFRVDGVLALVNLAHTYYFLGELSAAARLAEEAKEECREAFPIYAAFGHVLGACAAASLGRFAEVDSEFLQAERILQPLNLKHPQIVTLAFKLEMLLLMGRQVEAEEVVTRLEALIEETANQDTRDTMRLLKAQTLGRGGKLAAAKAEVEKAVLGAHAARRRAIEARALATKAWLMLREGAHEEARRVAQEALSLAEACSAGPTIAEARALLGEIALAVGGHDAGSHFEALEAIAKRLDSPLHLAQALFGLAAAAPYAGDAQAHVTEAQRLLADVSRPLDEERRETLFGRPELRRVVEGNYIAFGLPTARTQPPTPRPSLGMGGMMPF